MSEDPAVIVAWLESPAGEAWSRARSAASRTDTPLWMGGVPLGEQDLAEDPCGRPALNAEEIAATGTDG